MSEAKFIHKALSHLGHNPLKIMSTWPKNDIRTIVYYGVRPENFQNDMLLALSGELEPFDWKGVLDAH